MASNYRITLTFAQIVALVDIDEGYSDLDSPRWDLRTLIPLETKSLITKLPPRDKIDEMRDKNEGRIWGTKLTKKGRAYLVAALYEYNACRAELEERWAA
jgi:hypothetical protein